MSFDIAVHTPKFRKCENYVRKIGQRRNSEKDFRVKELKKTINLSEKRRKN